MPGSWWGIWAHLKRLEQSEVDGADTGLCGVPGEVLCTVVARAVTAHTSVVDLKQRGNKLMLKYISAPSIQCSNMTRRRYRLESNTGTLCLMHRQQSLMITAALKGPLRGRNPGHILCFLPSSPALFRLFWSHVKATLEAVVCGAVKPHCPNYDQPHWYKPWFWSLSSLIYIKYVVPTPHVSDVFTI